RKPSSSSTWSRSPSRDGSGAPPPPALLPSSLPPGGAGGRGAGGGGGGGRRGRLEKPEMKAIDDHLALVRKLPGLGSSMTFGEGGPRHPLAGGKGKTPHPAASAR